jgi:hypothetical protein
MSLLLSRRGLAAEVELTSITRRQGDQLGPGHHNADHISVAALKLGKVEPEKSVQVRVGPVC